MRRVLIAAGLVVVLSGLSGRTALAGSAPGKISGKVATVPSIPAGGTTAGGTGRVNPGTGVVDPTGKLAKVCPKYPGKYSACTPPPPAPVSLAGPPPADVCPMGCRFSSLAEALAGTPSGGIIRLAPGTYVGGVGIAKSVTLVGAGAGLTVIRGGGPVIRITAGITVMISGLTITGGSTPRGNFGFDPANAGAGIHNEGTLTVIMSSVSGNRGEAGTGGIYNDLGATLMVTGSTIDGNYGGPGPSGIYNLGRASLVDSSVSGNTGTVGGIGNSGTITLTNTHVNNNIAGLDWPGFAGGISNSGTTTLINSTVSDNRGTSPGAVGGIRNTATVTLINSTVSGNTASFVGGGIYNNFGGLVNWSGSSITGNIPDNCAGSGTFTPPCTS